MFHVKHPKILCFTGKRGLFHEFPRSKKKVKQVEMEKGKCYNKQSEKERILLWEELLQLQIKREG